MFSILPGKDLLGEISVGLGINKHSTDRFPFFPFPESGCQSKKYHDFLAGYIGIQPL
jgi:hypothetical protein